MTTIPASQLVSVLPGVLAAGGTALNLVGLVLSQNARIPTGQVLSFSGQTAVAAYFGAADPMAIGATTYFNGFAGATKQPGAMLAAQFPAAGAAAFLRGGNAAAALTLAQLQGLNGTVIATVDGFVRTSATINLAAAGSFSAAAALIQTGMNAAPATVATSTGSTIAAATWSMTGSISGNVMTVTAVTSGTVANGSTVAGTGVTASTTVVNQLSGTTGGIGTYAVSINHPQGVASTALSGTYGLMTIGAPVTGLWAVGETVTGGGTLANTVITQLGTGTGGIGTYFVNLTQVVASAALAAQPTPVVVTFDSVSGGFVVTSGVVGAASTIGFATGTISTQLLLTAATGAVISQGAAAPLPGPFMDSLVAITQNWATFMHAFQPDAAGTTGTRMAFSNWTNGKNNRYLYVARDFDVVAVGSVPATSSFGYAVQQSSNSGTSPVWEPSDLSADWFMCGAIASIDFSAAGGRTTLDYLSQSGLVAGVTDGTSSVNLAGNPQVPGSFGNGYNYYGVYGAAAQNFITLQRGTVSGPFQWIDSFVNQIWMNNAFQLALLLFLTQATSVPYNVAGTTAIEAALAAPINQALAFGAIRTGVALSPSQVSQVTAAVAAAGGSGSASVASVLQTRGWYLLIGATTPANRQARVSPPMVFYYVDGQSVQALTLSSIELQ